MKPSDSIPEFVAELATSPREQQELSELFAKLSELSPPELAQGRARLLAAVTGTEERYAPLFGQLTRFFDLSADALRQVFARAADESQWQPGPLPWVSLFHLQGGPAVAGLDTGFVRLSKGLPFPHHEHLGSERVIILEGGYHDSDGRWYGPGATHDMEQGSRHALQMNPDRDTLLAVILSGEIQVVTG